MSDGQEKPPAWSVRLERELENEFIRVRALFYLAREEIADRVAHVFGAILLLDRAQAERDERHARAALDLLRKVRK